MSNIREVSNCPSLCSHTGLNGWKPQWESGDEYKWYLFSFILLFVEERRKSGDAEEEWVIFLRQVTAVPVSKVSYFNLTGSRYHFSQ